MVSCETEVLRLVLSDGNKGDIKDNPGERGGRSGQAE